MRFNYWVVLLLTVTAGVWLAGCSPTATATGTPEGQTLREKAALEATAIVERAEATAMVLRAQSTAAALIQSASGPTSTPMPPAPTAAPATAPSAALTWQVPTLPVPTGAASPLPAPAETVTTTGEAAGVELLGVSFGADGAYIFVQYKAHPKVAEKFWPGVLSVVDEANGAVYNEVPVMPVIGPLIARPKQEGQLGYVMLVNAPPGLHPGSIVTVVLGDFRQEHVTVQ